MILIRTNRKKLRGKSERDMFLVRANLNNDLNKHSYPIGVFSNILQAIDEARKEQKMGRGFGYGFRILRMPVNCNVHENEKKPFSHYSLMYELTQEGDEVWHDETLKRYYGRG